MADYTTNYNLKKPADTDFYNVADFNGNADIIDTALNSKLEKDLSNISGGAVPVANGGTGATTVAGAKSNLGLGNNSWVTFAKTICNSIEVVDSYPYIDFAPDSQTDFEVRIAKNGTRQLNIEGANGDATLKINGNKVYNSGSNMTDLQKEICANNKGYLVCDTWGEGYFNSYNLNDWTQTGIFASTNATINAPSDTDGWGLIEILRHDTWLIQRATFVNEDFATYNRQGVYDTTNQVWVFDAWEKRTSLYVQSQQPNNAPNLSLWAW